MTLNTYLKLVNLRLNLQVQLLSHQLDNLRNRLAMSI